MSDFKVGDRVKNVRCGCTGVIESLEVRDNLGALIDGVVQMRVEQPHASYVENGDVLWPAREALVLVSPPAGPLGEGEG